MFINNSESGLDKLFQSCRITLQHSGFVNLLPRIYGHVIQGGDGEGEGSDKKRTPQNFESSHAVKARAARPQIMAFYHDVGENTRSARAPTPGGQQYQRESIASYAGTQPYWVLLGAIAPDCLYIRRSFSM